MPQYFAEEEGKLLDELLDKDTDKRFESAGDVLGNRRKKTEDDEKFKEQVRKLNEPEDETKSADKKDDKEKGTLIPEAEREKQKLLYEEWKKISKKLFAQE